MHKKMLCTIMYRQKAPLLTLYYIMNLESVIWLRQAQPAVYNLARVKP